MIKKVLIKILFLFWLIPGNYLAQTISPFNHIETIDTSSNYSFIVSGHFHGASTNLSTFPASSLLANIDTLNNLHPFALFTLGDIFIDVNESIINNYELSLFNKLKMPMFNAVGNHDLANGNMYEKIYGKTYFSFKNNSELFIVLNTEMNDGSIKNEQLTLFTNALKEASANSSIKNIFIFSHRPVWAESIAKYSKLFNDNTRTAIGKNNFNTDLLPVLKTVSKAKNIYWMSGSMGGKAPASFFYDKDEETNITFMQTAIRDLPRDAVLHVTINNSDVSLKGISFTEKELKPIEDYNIDFWSNTTAPEKKFNFRMLPFLFKQMLFGLNFWLGFISSSILIILFLFIRKKRWTKSK